MSDVRYFSNSELQTFKRCKRSWYLAYYRRLRLKAREVTGPRSLGSLVHSALEIYYVPEGETRGDPVQYVINSLQDQFEEFDEEFHSDIEKEHDLARIMVEGYMDWLAETGADAFLRVTAAEQELFVPIGTVRGEDVGIMGKLDVRVYDEEVESRWFMDHKTVGSFARATDLLHMNEQMLHYMLLEKLHGGEAYCAGGIYNMLRKTKRTSRAKPPFYDRDRQSHNEQELRSYFSRVMGTIDDVLAREEALDNGEASPLMVVPPTQADSCRWGCDFLPACPMFDDGSHVEGFLEEYYVEHDPNARYAGLEDAP